MVLFATAIYIAGIAGLLFLNRETRVRTSWGLWIPIAWWLLNSSRPVSVWLQVQQANTFDKYLEGSPLDRAVYLALIAVGVFALWPRACAYGQVLRKNAALFAFFAYCALSIAWTPYPDVAFKRWIKALGDVVMVLLILTERYPLVAVQKVLGITGIILAPASILLIKYYPDLSRYYSSWEGQMSVSGASVDKNMLGMSCMILGVGAWWRVLHLWREPATHRRWRQLLAQSVLLLSILWLFYRADSKTSLACFALGSTLMTVTFLFRFARRRKAIHWAVGAIVVGGISVLFLNVGSFLLEALGREPTLTGRTDIWKVVLQFAANPWIGTGYEGFWIGDRLEKIWAVSYLMNGLNESHNGYLEVFINLGWIGVALLVATLYAGYRNVLRGLGSNSALGHVGLAFFVMVVVYGFTEAAFRSMSVVWLGFLLAAMAVPEAAPMRAPVKSHREADAFDTVPPARGDHVLG